MSIDHENEKKRRLLLPDEEEGGGEAESGTGSAGGAAGEIEFRYQDIVSVGLRDDLVTGKELKRLLAVHGELHKSRVDDQKIKRKDRKFAKEGQASLTARSEAVLAHRARGGGRVSPYKQHKIIGEKAQFSGIDQQVSPLPSKNNAETNNDQRNELENRNELRNENRNRLTHSNRYTPKPRGF